MIAEGKSKTPDISFSSRADLGYCEVKTIGISDKEIKRRSNCYCLDGRDRVSLDPCFLEKLRKDVDTARQQISSAGGQGFTYVIINFDDIALDYYHNYRKQLISFCRKRGLDDLICKFCVLGNRRLSIKGGFMRGLQ